MGYGLKEGGKDCLFVPKNLLAFPHKSENEAGEAVFTTVTPTSTSGETDTHMFLVLN